MSNIRGEVTMKFPNARPFALALAVASALADAALPGTAGAAAPTDNYPARPIRFVVAQAPGSSIDAMTRVVGTRMGELLGQQLVVDNRTGAGGTIGGAL